MWFLIQVKRFFVISYEEFFLFIKKFLNIKLKSFLKNDEKKLQKKYINSYEKQIEIKLDKKYYDFDYLQPKNEEPFYLTSPLFLIIKQNKINIFNNLISVFNLYYKFKIKIGLELEFYILNNTNNINIVKELKIKLQNFAQNIEKEKGNNQFEIKTKPYTDLNQLLDSYNNILLILKKFCFDNNLELNLYSSPFENDCGSALQINISMEDNNKNLFARIKNGNELTDSNLMLNCLAGLLKNINNNLLLYINDKSCLDRFDLNKNINLKNNDKYPAPTYISWGINNRSTAIRIPTPPFIDLKNYIETDNKTRRIEFRIPSANADIYLTFIGVLSSIIEGIEDNLIPHIEKNSFDILEKHEDLEKIEDNIDILNNNFAINQNIIFINK